MRVDGAVRDGSVKATGNAYQFCTPTGCKGYAPGRPDDPCLLRRWQRYAPVRAAHYIGYVSGRMVPEGCSPIFFVVKLAGEENRGT